MNRRKTIARSFSLWRLLGSRQNRKVRPRSSQAEAAERPRRDLGAAVRSVFRTLLRGLATAAKVTALLAVLGGAGATGYYAYCRVVTSTYFRVQEIVVRGASHAPESEIDRLVHSVQGRNIFTIDVADIERAVEGHPWVKSATIGRRLPRTLHIDVEEHRPVALVLLGHLYLVSQEGVVFKRAERGEREELPVITGIDRLTYLNTPARAEARVREALEALARYNSGGRPKLSEVHLKKDGAIALHLHRGGAAIRVGEELTETKLARLDAVWTALGPEAAAARIVFLDGQARQDRVVVRMGSYQ
jgi:cell division protein FtsQ